MGGFLGGGGALRSVVYKPPQFGYPVTFNPIVWESDTSGAPAAFKPAVMTVLGWYQKFFYALVPNVQIAFQVGWGTVNQQPLTGGSLGQSYYQILNYSYQQVRQALLNSATTVDAQRAALSLPATDPYASNPTGYWVSQAQAYALGLQVGSLSPPYDCNMGFDTTTGRFDYTGGLPTGGQVDFLSVCAHEVSENLGRFLVCNGTAGNPINGNGILDLFRWVSVNNRPPGTDNGTTASYCSFDNRATSINTFNTNSNDDFGDWAGASSDSFNAIGTANALNPVTAGDFKLLNSIGWIVNGTPTWPPI